MTDSTATDFSVPSADCGTAVLMFDEYMADLSKLLFFHWKDFDKRMTAIADACPDPLARQAVVTVIESVKGSVFEDSGKQLITFEDRMMNLMLDLRNDLTVSS